MEIVKSIIAWILALLLLGIMFPLTCAIWLIVWPFDRERTVTHWLLVYQAVVVVFMIPLWKIRIEGRKKALKGRTYVCISNHQSILDIPLINCLRFRFRWISKIENMKVPVLGWYLRMAGYITVNRGNEESKAEMLMKSYRSLLKGISIMIFPEGTRSVDGEIGFYRRGAFQLALQTGIPILPVLIDGTAEILPKHGLIFRGGHNVHIRVLDPVAPGDFDTDDPDKLAAAMNIRMKSELERLRSERIKK